MLRQAPALLLSLASPLTAVDGLAGHHAIACPEPAAPAPNPTLWMNVWRQAECFAALLLPSSSLGPSLWLAAWICGAALPETSHELIRLARPTLPPVLTPKWVVSELIEGLCLSASRACECAGGLEGLAVGSHGAFRHHHTKLIDCTV